MNKHGLTAKQIQTIENTLQPFLHKIDSVALFGSRAQGCYRSNSDIDMVLHGTITSDEIDRIYTLFQESNLPVKVDVVAYHLIRHLPLKTHIDQNQYTLWTAQND